MGWFSNSSAEEKSLPWIPLTNIEALTNALESTERPALFFKHSTRCSISIMALSRLEQRWSLGPEECDLYFIDLLNHRDVSNEIATKTNIVHQSPQAILLRNGEVIYTATHGDIDAGEMAKILSH
ncbi:MAG: bacillithiol system redox-active protein YtxJ [Flavobacteriia bacterium]|jgi:bacillithiol system protein YtxJ